MKHPVYTIHYVRIGIIEFVCACLSTMRQKAAVVYLVPIHSLTILEYSVPILTIDTEVSNYNKL